MSKLFNKGDRYLTARSIPTNGQGVSVIGTRPHTGVVSAVIAKGEKAEMIDPGDGKDHFIMEVEEGRPGSRSYTQLKIGRPFFGSMFTKV